MRVDLHIHTTASDGRWPPERVISEALRIGLGLISVTDHDTIGSVAACEELALDAGMRFLRGVEISSRLGDQVFHILGYGFDLDDRALKGLLSDNAEELERADDGAIESLIDAGVGIDLADYAAYEYDRTRGGWKALNFLIDRGVCADVSDYLERVWRERTVPEFAHPADVVAAIREAGGFPVVAHPRAGMEGMCLTEELLDRFVDWGIAGLECYHPGHDDDDCAVCLTWCRQGGLLVTGGSDCHGGLVGRELGVPVIADTDLELGELVQRVRH
jgi:predicted metal-dependent phosphoesterase TrpH